MNDDFTPQIQFSALDNVQSNCAPKTLAEMPFIWTPFTIVPQEAAAQIRAEFKLASAGGIKQRFRDYATEIFLGTLTRRADATRIKKFLSSFEIHHKLPIQLGGTNEFDNLILIDQQTHKAIHVHLDFRIGLIENAFRDYFRSSTKKSIKRGLAKGQNLVRPVDRLHNKMKQIPDIKVRADFAEVQRPEKCTIGHILAPFPEGCFHVPAATPR